MCPVVSSFSQIIGLRHESYMPSGTQFEGNTSVVCQHVST